MGVEGAQGLVPAERGRQRGGEQRVPEAGAAAADMALSPVLAAFVVERRQARQSRGLFSADLAEFGHADDQCQPVVRISAA